MPFITQLQEDNTMSKQIHVGAVAVGGGAPVSIQSMCNTKTDDVAATVAQIHALEAVSYTHLTLPTT